MDSKFVKAFIIGSSLPATIWTFSLAGISNKRRPHKDFETIMIAVSVIFGLLNGIMVLFPGENHQRRMFYIGAIFGLLFAAYGTCLSNFHCNLLGISPQYKYFAFIWEAFFYSLVWGIVIYNMNHIFGLY